MSSSAEKFTEIATVTALCKHLHKGVVRNRLTGSPYNVVSSSNPKFAFMLPNFKDDQIEVNGSFTWGDSGFSFAVKISSDGKSIILSLKAHRNCTLTQSQMEQIIYHLMGNAKSKLTNEFPIKKETFKEPMLLAYSASKKPSQTTIDNINHFVAQKIFDEQFGNALITHHNDGIRCHRKREKPKKHSNSTKK